MKFNSLPQPICAKLLTIEAHVSEMVLAAEQAEGKVAYARSVINNTIDAGPEVFAQQRDGFSTIHAEAQRLRQRADAGRVTVAGIHQWIESLGPGTKLSMVAHPSADGLDSDDLAAMKTKLAAMRDELRTLNGNPSVASDISKRVDELVAGYAKAALPFVRGFAQGQSLDVRWPMDMTANVRNGSACDPNNCNPLLMFAAINPTAVAELIMRAVKQAQPLSKAQHATRRNELEQAVDEMSYALAFALDNSSESPDLHPRHHLGVRLTTDPPVDKKAILTRLVTEATADEKAAMAHVIADRLRGA